MRDAGHQGYRVLLDVGRSAAAWLEVEDPACQKLAKYCEETLAVSVDNYRMSPLSTHLPLKLSVNHRHFKLLHTALAPGPLHGIRVGPRFKLSRGGFQFSGRVYFRAPDTTLIDLCSIDVVPFVPIAMPTNSHIPSLSTERNFISLER